MLIEKNDISIKLLAKSCISRTARNELKDLLTKNKNEFKLIMTIVCKDEEAIIEQQIRFHKAMGVDGFIVINHNSIDNTLNILKKLKEEGIVYEIINKTTSYHEHNVWVDEMIRLAKDKYEADWVINSDADEFYFSKSLDLKESIRKANDANVIMVDSIFFVPDGRDDFFSCPYFLTRPFYKFEVELFNLDGGAKSSEFMCPKVIHKTKGYRSILPGNHDIDLKNKKAIVSADINLYHYHIKNYKFYEAKVVKWEETLKYIPDFSCKHIRTLLDLYQNGKLKENYESDFGDKKREFLIEHGVVTIDPSVYNFLKYTEIL